ncbi:hypothetical protein [Beijerinckia sp. L45]|uniref:hypothetical protein n=1 Tax=Beijerinckia sp. L45 TaxID=1641855 RepID=UPI00131E6D74|nr:hypothetical protein [Beijerinckia sp. L45]
MASSLSFDAILRGVGLDRYALNARLKPALLGLLPIFLVVGFWVPEARTMVGAFVSAATACGLTFLLAQIARNRGRTLERRLGDRVGRLHSARLLTFADRSFAAETKNRYHTFLLSKNIRVSTADEEKASPDDAFDRARAAVDWLLVHTLPDAKKSLLFEENIAYGFARNLYGIKAIAISIAVLAMMADAAMIFIRLPDRSPAVGGSIVGALLLLALAMWVFFVNEDLVRESSLAYAQRLFSQCEPAAAAEVA